MNKNVWNESRFQNYSSLNACVHYENLSYYLYMNLKTHKIQQHFKQPQNILFLKYLRRPLLSWTKLHVTLLLGEIKTAQKNDRFLNLLRFFPPEVTTPMLTIYAEENWRKWHLHAIIFREHIISSNGSSVLYRVQYTSCCCVIGLYDNKNHHIHIFINT